MGLPIGLDVGYGFVKVTDGESGYVFPSVVGEGHTQPVFRAEPQRRSSIDDLRVGMDGRVFFVGKAAIRHSRLAFRDLSPSRAEADDLRILSYAALGLFSTGPVNQFEVVTGLPPGRMYLAPALADMLRGTHHLTLYHQQRQQEVDIQVSRVEVVPQPLGTYWAQAMQAGGGINEAGLGRIGVIDIGFRTTDLAAIEDGEFIPEKSRTVAVGLATAYDDIANRLLVEHGLEREPHALDEAVIRGRVNVGGRIIDITSMRSEVFAQLGLKIFVEVNSTWRILDFDRLLVSGGGGQALSTYLLQRLPQAELVPDAITANSKGYLAWANRLRTMSLEGAGAQGRGTGQ